jgi:hypothetical protein
VIKKILKVLAFLLAAVILFPVLSAVSLRLYYLQYHYCPADKVGEAVAKTLEYAWSDYAISELADALGKKEDAVTFAEHAQYYHVGGWTVGSRLRVGGWTVGSRLRGD